MKHAGTNNRLNSESINQVLMRRGPRYGRHYKLSLDSCSLAIVIPGQPYVNRQAMSARAVISTSTIDRVGDVLVPSGCQLSNFAKNPVVLWAHGLEGVGHPIATSRDPSGRLSVTITNVDVQATAWFSQSSVEAVQIFELIDEGIVRATSVRETPLKSCVRRDPEAGDILIVEQWDLEEWSWCAVGVNPDAVAKTLDRNRLDGRPIAPSILKSLHALAPNPRRFGVGIPQEKTVTEQVVPNNDINQSTADDPTTSWDCDDDEYGTQPYGATVIAAVHLALSAANRNISDALGPLENPVVFEGLESIQTAIHEQLTALEGIYAENYPQQPVLKVDDDRGEEDGSAIKAFLASGNAGYVRVRGIGARLKGIIGAPNLTSVQRSALAGIGHQLFKLISESKSSQAQREADKIAQLQSSIHELNGLVARLKS